MKIVLFILSALTIISIYEACKYYLASMVLTSWMIENNCEQPSDDDIERLIKFVVHKLIHGNK